MVDSIGNLVLYRTPSKAVIKNRREFYALRKKRGESTEKWLKRVRTHVNCCEFLTFSEYLLIDKFICGLNNEEIESIQNAHTWTLELLNEYFISQPAGNAVNTAVDDQNQIVSLDIVKCESVSTLKWTYVTKFIMINRFYFHVVCMYISGGLRIF